MCESVSAYFRDVFYVGKSAQSLISDVIDVIRTFQKMSAPNTFYFHISKDFHEMFIWASDIIEIICNLCGNPNFSELEKFFAFTFAFPLSICTFISAMLLSSRFYIHFLMVGIALAFPIGIFSITKFQEASMGIGLIIGSIVLLVITIVLVCKFGNFNVDEEFNYFIVSFLSAFTILTFLLIPCLYDKKFLAVIFCILIVALLFAILIVEIISKFCNSDNSFGYKAIGLAINIYSLTVIPSTKSFFILLGDPNFLKWNIVCAYVLISIVLPIVFTLTMIFTEHPDLQFRYKDFGYFFFELFDQLKQIAYIFCAEFDKYWGCISLEIIWVISIFIFRPYSAISEYVMESSTSLFLMISNGLLFKVGDNKNKIFGVSTQVAFFLMGIIPAIVSFFCYFIFDFGNKAHENDDIESLNIMGQVIIYGIPVVWIFAALNYEVIYYLF